MKAREMIINLNKTINFADFLAKVALSQSLINTPIKKLKGGNREARVDIRTHQKTTYMGSKSYLILDLIHRKRKKKSKKYQPYNAEMQA